MPSLLNVFLSPFLLGLMTFALPLLIAKLSALNPLCQSEWLAPGKTPDPVTAHPWVRLGQLDSPFHKCEWKAQKEGPVGGGHGSWEVLGDWGNRTTRWMNTYSAANDPDSQRLLAFLFHSLMIVLTIPWHSFYPFNNHFLPLTSCRGFRLFATKRAFFKILIYFYFYFF